ncbi:MAG TPA: DUF3656 domain-containing protein, partial [Mobilitalea sp.]|nr:DUF3656 domain-containing protein [Mobilitalea sp.]
NLLRESGVTRLVTARELSLKEIKQLREHTDMEIETFVHGALCYCYSGQCLMSSMLGGRSGNRGRCAQPCRMPYQFYSDEKRISSERDKYLLSPKDINTIVLIPEMVEAGINSFKIEGRMKRPEYSAGVASLYRKYTDLYLEYGKSRYQELISSCEYEKDMIELQDLYNRGGFSAGYGKAYHGKKMMSLYRPNHSGVHVGKVTGVKGSLVDIMLEEVVNAQDILEIRYQEEEQGHEFTVKAPNSIGQVITTNVGRTIKPIYSGADVYRTRNNELLKRITEDYIDKDNKQGIRGILRARIGERLTFTLTYKDYMVTAYQDIVQTAQRQPMTVEKLSTPIEKLGDTPYFMEELTVDAEDNIFVPVAWLNEIRREAVRLLQEAVVGSYQREIPEGGVGPETIAASLQQDATPQDKYRQDKKTTPGICVTVRSKEQFQATLAFTEVDAIYADYDGFSKDELVKLASDSNKEGKAFFVILPHIMRVVVYEKLKRDIAILWMDDNVTGFVAKNFEEVSLLQSFQKDGDKDKIIILNHNMYIFNKVAKEFWRTRGVSHFTAPVEQNSGELKSLGISDSDMIVYGYLPLMVSAQCLHESTAGCKKCREGEQRTDYMVDRLGKKFYVQTNCSGCYNIIYNGQCLSLLKYAKEVTALKPANLRLDFTFEKGKEVEEVIVAFLDMFKYGRSTELTATNLTAGHFRRGVE